MRRVLSLLPGLVFLFGLACLNYTKAGSWEHHGETAARHGFPPPSQAIFYGGVLATALGAAGLGFAAGSSGRTKPASVG